MGLFDLLIYKSPLYNLYINLLLILRFSNNFENSENFKFNQWLILTFRMVSCGKLKFKILMRSSLSKFSYC